MSTAANQSGNNPNAATTPQNQPVNSTAGNTSSGASGNGEATSANSNAGGTPGGNAGGAPAATNTVTFTPEQEAEIARRSNAAAAAARRDEQERAERQRTTAEAEARGDVQTLLDNERAAHGETRRQLDDMTRQHNALTVALEENLPNPTLVAPRLRGNTLDELRADARSFAGLLGQALPRPAEAPATPPGGGSPEPPAAPANTGGAPGDSSSTANVTDADASAEMRSGMYGSLG